MDNSQYYVYLSVYFTLKQLLNLSVCLPLYCCVCLLTQIFAHSGQVLKDSMYSHNLPVMLQS